MCNEKQPKTHQVSNEDFLLLQDIKNHKLATVSPEQFELIDFAEELGLSLSKELIEALNSLEGYEPGEVANKLTYMLCLLFNEVDAEQFGITTKMIPSILMLQEVLHIWQKTKDVQETERYYEQHSATNAEA